MSILLRKIIGRIFFRKAKPLNKRYPEYDIGYGTYGDLTVRYGSNGVTLKIGAYCSLGPGVQIWLGGNHRQDWVTTYPFSEFWEAGKHIKGHPSTKGDVIIGNDVWIGTEALILSGVRIGDGAVIGTRSVVTRDVSPYSIVVGNPARCVKKRFDASIVDRLLALHWWNWDRTKIEKFLPMLLNEDIGAFLEAAENVDEVDD